MQIHCNKTAIKRQLIQLFARIGFEIVADVTFVLAQQATNDAIRHNETKAIKRSLGHRTNILPNKILTLIPCGSYSHDRLTSLSTLSRNSPVFCTLYTRILLKTKSMFKFCGTISILLNLHASVSFSGKHEILEMSKSLSHRPMWGSSIIFRRHKFTCFYYYILLSHFRRTFAVE